MTWRVQISGEKVDLDALANAFNNDDHRLFNDENQYFLESKKFENASGSNEVLTMANDLLGVLSGIARLEFGAIEPFKPGHVLRVRPDGRKDFFLPTDALHFRVKLGKVKFIISGGRETNVENADPARSWASIAYKDEAVSKALRLFGKDANNWEGLYRLLEVIEADVGETGGIVAAGWATKRSLIRFKRTANSPSATGDLARHGKERTQPPKNPMTLPEAGDLIEVILHGWLRSKGNGSA